MMLLRHTIENRTFDLSLKGPLMMAVVVFLVAMAVGAAWMTLAPLSAASLASGKLVTELNNQTVQHHTGGVVERLLVKEGQPVERGDLLLTLSDPVLASRLSQLEQQQFINRTRLARIDAEINQQPLIWDGAEFSALTPVQQQFWHDQEALLAQNRQLHQVRVESFKQQVRQTINDQDSFKAWLASDQSSLELLNEELDAKKQLLKKGFVSRLSLLELQRQSSTLKAKVAEHTTNIQRTASKINELNSNLAALNHRFIQNAQEQKQEIISSIQSLEQQLTAARQLSDRVDLRAPVSGEVINLTMHTEGGVVAPGGVIMEIVPRHSSVIASVNIHPQDIESVYEGLTANVRLSSFSYRKVPAVTGVLTYVSADSVIDQQNGTQVYQGKIALDASELATLGLELKPGMPVQAQIIVEERTVLDYLVSPLLESMENGMREI